jgi:hypothetical protein
MKSGFLACSCALPFLLLAAIPSDSQTPASSSQTQNALKVAPGTAFFASLLTPIVFNKAKNEDPIEAQTTQDIKQGKDVVLKKGSTLIGRLQSVQLPAADKPDTSLVVVFDRVRPKNGEEARLNLIIQALAPKSDMESDMVSPGTGGGMQNATRVAGISGHSSATRGSVAGLSLSSTGVIDMLGLDLAEKISEGKHYTVLISSRKDMTLKKESQLVMKIVGQ